MSTRILKAAKTAVALLLIPLCIGTAQALIDLTRSTGAAETIWVPILAGSACWLAIYLILPEPMWVYVFGHELTHALWAWLLGGKVTQFRATAKGGHVVVTRKNFVVALAPYFFPIYAVAVVLVYLPGHWLWGWSQYRVWFHLLLGAAYAFHVTLTWRILRTRQSDIIDQGYLFSAVVIWLGNLAFLVIAIPLLTGQVGLWKALGSCYLKTGELLQALSSLG